MDEKIDQAIEKMADQTKAAQGDAQKALHYSQAALNLAHTKQILTEGNRGRKQGAGA